MKSSSKLFSRSSNNTVDGNASVNQHTSSRPSSPEKAIERAENMSIASRGTINTKMTTTNSRKENKKQLSASQQLSQENQTKSIIENLQQQLKTAQMKMKEYENEINNLKTSISSREQELSRTNLNNSSYNVANPPSVSLSSGISPADAALLNPFNGMKSNAADIANKRIMDHLNTNVDYLNDQVAQKEAQIKQLHNELLETETLKMELNSKIIALERIEDEKNRLTIRLQAAEKKVSNKGLRLLFRFLILSCLLSLSCASLLTDRRYFLYKLLGNHLLVLKEEHLKI
jgi:chromosome segregation ATPase